MKISPKSTVRENICVIWIRVRSFTVIRSDFVVRQCGVKKRAYSDCGERVRYTKPTGIERFLRQQVGNSLSRGSRAATDGYNSTTSENILDGNVSTKSILCPKNAGDENRISENKPPEKNVIRKIAIPPKVFPRRRVYVTIYFNRIRLLRDVSCSATTIATIPVRTRRRRVRTCSNIWVFNVCRV